MSVVIETTIGDITVDLFVKERPKACLNFLKLCKLKYYNYNLFHTVEPGFIAQTGDQTGDGDKGESVWGVLEGPKKKYFEAEMIPKILHSVPGLLSMVSTGDNFIGSQFFFTLGTDLASLDGIHCVIGEVAEGHEVLRMLNEAITDDKHRPYKDIRITHTVIIEDPYADPRGFKQPSRSPSPSAERLKNGRIAADEDIDDTQGKTEAEIHEMLQEREAKARATILEIVGDIPDADIAPPENVLFVCKLNPVTTDDDLQIIFSRFGKIKTCEVIRDKVSGDSMQYAFIEFEEQKSCEDAYFKMDNVLIDDRRIHVDFSQSVSKVKWRGKGNYTIHDDADRFKSDRGHRRKSRSPRKVSARRSRSPQKVSARRSRSPRKVSARRSRSPRRLSPRKSRSPRRSWRRSRSPRRRSRSPRRNVRAKSPYQPYRSSIHSPRSPRKKWDPNYRYYEQDYHNDHQKQFSESRHTRSPPRRRTPAREPRRLPDRWSQDRVRQSSDRARRSSDRNRRDRDDYPKRNKSSSKSARNRRSSTSSESSSSSYDKRKKKSSRKDKKRRDSSSSDSDSSYDRKRKSRK